MLAYGNKSFYLAIFNHTIPNYQHPEMDGVHCRDLPSKNLGVSIRKMR
jgi:hypothetical protein